MIEEVKRIINNWNPAEIYPLLDDEYSYEIKKLVDLTSATKSKEELAKKIYDLFYGTFGKEFRKSYSECHEIAEYIIVIMLAEEP